LFASRIADAVLEGQQMLTEGGATTEATEPGEATTASAEAPMSAPEEPGASEIATAPANPESAEAQTEDQTESAEVVAAS
jgi:hypothetical protein